MHAGNLILLRRRGNRAEGRFDRTWAGFMALRSSAARRSPTNRLDEPGEGRGEVVARSSELNMLRPWENLVVWFLVGLSVSAEIGYRHTIDETSGQPADVLLTSSDGSWCQASQHPGSGRVQVREGGPTQLWRAVENADRLWRDIGEPGWERFGLTVTPDRQWVWLEASDSEYTWTVRRTPDGGGLAEPSRVTPWSRSRRPPGSPLR